MFKLNTPEKREKLLKKLKIGFLIPSSLIVLAVITSYILEWLLIGGSLFLLGFLLLELFMISFWILNLIVMWKWKKRGLFFIAIILPFVSLIFYWTEFLPFLKEEKIISTPNN